MQAEVRCMREVQEGQARQEGQVPAGVAGHAMRWWHVLPGARGFQQREDVVRADRDGLLLGRRRRGSCLEGQTCCAPGSVERRGTCAPSDASCCENGNGGFSTPNFPICCPAGSQSFNCSLTFPSCCANGSRADCCPEDFPNCCPEGSGADCCPDDFPNCCPEGSEDNCCPGDTPNCCPAGFPDPCCPANAVCDATDGCVAEATASVRGASGRSGASGGGAGGSGGFSRAASGRGR
jgi:hypothetical protein